MDDNEGISRDFDDKIRIALLPDTGGLPATDDRHLRYRREAASATASAAVPVPAAAAPVGTPDLQRGYKNPLDTDDFPGKVDIDENKFRKNYKQQNYSMHNVSGFFLFVKVTL